MRIAALHPWDLSPREAMALQRELARRVIARGAPRERDARLVAGADVAFDRAHGRAVGALVVLSYPGLQPVEMMHVETPLTFPYVPGLLSFRETPVLLGAFERLAEPPGLVFADGHGYAHPRRFGFACHLGLLLDLPTIGVAKTRLIGEHGTVAPARGARADLCDAGEVIGTLLRTKERVRPVYVSVGHRIGLDAAARWTLACARAHRLPEPARLADRLSRDARRRMVELTLEIVVEQRAGEPGRWEWVAADDAVVFRHDLDPMPAHYGCSVDIVNPADGELLDVMLVDPRGREPARGERMHARVVDVLERGDGDHKLLAVPVDVEPFAGATLKLLARERRRIWRWFVAHDKPVIRWAGEDRALGVIGECRSAAP